MSTAVPDVVADFADVVYIGANHDAFVRDLAAAQRPDPERQVRARAKVSAGSWDAVVDSMTADLAAFAINLAAPENHATCRRHIEVELQDKLVAHYVE